jgi:steroid Delta-isomerase
MPTPEQMTAAVHAYVEGFDKADVEMIMSLFADDATVEDPVGTPIRVGHEIREFYTGSIAAGAKLVLEGPIRIADNHAAFPFSARLSMDGNEMQVDVIDIFKFNHAGKVIEMKTFFGPGNMHGF